MNETPSTPGLEEAMEKALKPFAAYACDGESPDHCHNCAARAALEGREK